MKQILVTKTDNLLDEFGHLKHPGYAHQLVLKYNRKQVKASKIRIKEWDYYFFGNDQYGISFAIADNSYMCLIGATFFDFQKGLKYDNKKIFLFPFGKLKMPNDSMVGDINYTSNKVEFRVELKEKTREIYIYFLNFYKKKPLTITLEVHYTNKDSLVIMTPFKEDPKAFYYNQKINNLVASGEVIFGKETYQFSNEQGVLDWGRGVWTKDNTWNWSSLSTILKDGSSFGFNLGYGFGDLSSASENMAFYQGKAYKLNDVDFGLNKDDILNPWNFTSKDRAINMAFTPLYDNRTDINLIVLRQDAHQVFGYFDGYIQISKDKKIKLEKAFGFAEKVRNVW